MLYRLMLFLVDVTFPRFVELHVDIDYTLYI